MQQVVNKLNDCFVNLGPGLAEQISLQSVQPREYLKGDYLSSMFLEPNLEDEVRLIILNLKNSSPGWDDLKHDIIKHVCQYITLPVTHIVNLSVENGIVSWELKKAKVIPIVKGGDTKVFTNDRPVSVLPVFFKNIRTTNVF